MTGLLLKGAGVIFLLALAVMMIRMFFAKGSKLKALAYLVGYAFVLFGFSRMVNINPISNPNPAVQELQATELQGYLADSKNSYALGVQALANKDYLQAINLLSEVLPGDPNMKDAQAKLALARQGYAGQLLDKGRETMLAGGYDQAVKLFDEALSYDENLVEAKKLKLDALTRKQLAKQAQADAKAAQDLRQTKQQMGQYEFGTGNLGFAVKRTKVTDVIPTNMGFSYTSRANERFLWVYVSVTNRGKYAALVNLDNFYISSAGGPRIARSEATFSQEHLPGEAVKPGSTSEGWVIFYTPVQKQYTLSYFGTGFEVDKVIMP